MNNDYIWLAHFPKITPVRQRRLTAGFLCYKKLANIDWIDLKEAGWDENIAHEFIVWREQNPWEKINARLVAENITAISIDDDTYPPLLKQITDPPLVLFVRGRLPSFKDSLWLSVVGTRRHTLYGKQVCLQLVEDLAAKGIIIVSGLALGIDGLAHQATLNKKGMTVAVLGSGIDKMSIYPKAHEQLAEKIITNGGAVISEYPPGFVPTSYSFPARNRIIAGLTVGTLVIEAPEESGSLITAQVALDYNREVLAIPHPINSLTGIGNNKLIQNGATLITNADEILEALNWNTIGLTKPQLFSSDPEENKILDHLSGEPRHTDFILRSVDLEAGKTMAILTLLEMKGMIRNLGGGQYIKN